MDSTITLRKYLSKNKTFVVPDYQRGYIWGKRRPNPNDFDSVSYILNTLFSKYESGDRVFLQGVTVTEEKDTIVLIDGQQRTTFLYILLKLLGYKGAMTIRYDIRDKSQEFLESLDHDKDYEDSADEKYQDIYFFKKTIRLIKERLNKHQVDKESMLEYILDNIRFLYINIPANQAKKVFTMMNGNRAKMLESEIIKAELLRLVSLPLENGGDDNDLSLSMLRSRYAREWDRWMHWWNVVEVRRVYKIDTVLGWLLVAVMPSDYDSVEKVTFDSFCRVVIRDFRVAKAAKDAFYKLRQCQKRFEDAYHDPKRHNIVGAILRISREQAKFIKYYFGGKQVGYDELYRYYLCTFIGMTHDTIVNETQFAASFTECYNKTLRALKNPFIYDDKIGEKEVAFRTLLRMNIDEDNLQNQGLGRRFDFSIWDDRHRSLEHIYPKSQVLYYDKETDSYRNYDNKECALEAYSLIRDDIGKIDDVYPMIGEDNQEAVSLVDTRNKECPQLVATEHCIGNLVLLYRDDNSTFNASDFQRKKEIFLVGEEKNGRKELFKSRHLLHTVCHFAESNWTACEIRKYFANTLDKFCKSYTYIRESIL